MSFEIENDTFFDLNGKICFIEKNGLRRKDIEPEDFYAAEKSAKMLFDEDKTIIIELKIRQLLGDETLNFADRINLQAAETFPKEERLRWLLLRDLSVDMPEVRLTPVEKKELDDYTNRKDSDSTV